MLLNPSYPNAPKVAPADASPPPRLLGRLQDMAGFTLIELLIVCLIIGVLAAIAIPLFAGPQENAVGAQAKSLVGSTATAVAAYAAGNSGSYEGLTRGALHKQEPSITVSKSTRDAYISRASGDSTGYTISARATNGDEFTITDSAGAMTRTCLSTVSQTGCDGTKKSSW